MMVYFMYSTYCPSGFSPDFPSALGLFSKYFSSP